MSVIREFQQNDSSQVNSIALRAFEQYKNAYDDWQTFQAKIANVSSLADVGEIIVAEIEGKIVGAVAYVGPNAPKAEFFQPEWPIMRMLVVSPASRGLGIGRTLANECLCRANRDGAAVFGLHTSKFMQMALHMYQRMGFRLASSTPAIHGIEYDVYLKELDANPASQPTLRIRPHKASESKR